MTKMAQGKSVVHLHNSDLAKIDFLYPSYEEQCKISRSFSDLDHCTSSALILNALMGSGVTSIGIKYFLFVCRLSIVQTLLRSHTEVRIHTGLPIIIGHKNESSLFNWPTVPMGWLYSIVVRLTASGILDQGMNAETSEHIFVLLKV